MASSLLSLGIMATASKTIVLLGATGETGRQVLSAALQSSAVTSVYSFGRREPDSSDVPAGTSNKLHHVSIDFDKLLANDADEGRKLRDVDGDAVIVCLGTTRANAGGLDKFVKIDREYVLAAAKEARKPGKHQTLVYCSVSGGQVVCRIPSLTSVSGLKILSFPGVGCIFVVPDSLFEEQGVDGRGPRCNGLRRDDPVPTGHAGRSRRQEGAPLDGELGSVSLGQTSGR